MISGALQVHVAFISAGPHPELHRALQVAAAATAVRLHRPCQTQKMFASCSPGGGTSEGWRLQAGSLMAAADGGPVCCCLGAAACQHCT